GHYSGTNGPDSLECSDNQHYGGKGRWKVNTHKAALEANISTRSVDSKVDFRQSGFEKGASGRPFQR
ncbi:MAG: hypothetical protein IJV27_07965, partial [Prevotella sp.]|nr:hypothetical protein [Prevotella sp.]